MRDYQLQTPQKDFPVAKRQPKPAVDHQKKLKKVGKKNLISEFSATLEDPPVSDLTEESVDPSTPSQISAETLFTESDENLMASISPVASLTSESTPMSGLTSALTATSDKYENITTCQSAQSATMNQSSIEAELVINHLKQAQSQIRNAGDVDLLSKKILDALVNVLMEDFKGAVSEEKDQFNEQNSWKAYILYLSLLLWTLAMFVALSCFLGSKHAFRGPLPT